MSWPLVMMIALVPSTLTELQRIARRLASAEARANDVRAERDAAIVAAHARGESPKLIAVAAGISEPSVFKILRTRAREERADG